MTFNRVQFGWFGVSLMLLLGILLLFADYMLYKDAASDDQIARSSPVVCMKIIDRIKGMGTLKNPDKIDAVYKGKIYKLSIGRKSFRSLAGVDSVAVSFDKATDRAVMPASGRVRHLAFMFVMIAGVGIMVIWGSITEYIRLIKSSRKSHSYN
ncbi:hypothetical protein [Dyadobacter sp. CY356]|uniref:hypothetical protein n=1 Tax=Dyadobacter sp. CY356 TaxID=2906442 RepID=UPI001F4097E1|nr:hypothetical protein [Dyadobacter sp. CY356]MCF0059125.1 hypothetical protein [Dyadobacter sp. CY356]